MLRISLSEIKAEDLHDHKDSIYRIIEAHGLKDAVDGWGFDLRASTLDIFLFLEGVCMDAVKRALSTYNTNICFSW